MAIADPVETNAGTAVMTGDGFKDLLRQNSRRRRVVANRVTATLPVRWFLTIVCALAIGCSGAQSRIEGEKAEQVMRDIRSAEDTFLQRHGRYGEWKELIDAGLLSPSLAAGAGFGHRFELRSQGKNYQSVAVPIQKSDRQAYLGWSFYVDESRVIRGTPYGKDNGYARADKNSPPVRSQ